MKAKPRLMPWIWLALAVTIGVTATVLVVILLTIGPCGTSSGNPVLELLLTPARPLLRLFNDPHIDSLGTLVVSIGVAYGGPIVALGVLVNTLRRRARRGSS